MRVVDAIAQYFVNEGVEHYFGYIGGTIWPFLDALVDRPELKGIQPRHEAAAVQMADTYYRLKRKVAPVIVTKGPGVLNTVCAMSNAMHDSSAVVLISGAGATQFFDRGGFEEVYYHQTEDTTSVFRPLVKRAWLVVRPEHTLDIIVRAFKTATSGRPGPVFVQIPWDIQCSEINYAVPDPSLFKPQGRVRGDAKVVRKAAELLSAASKPLIVVGGGAIISQALPEILALSKKCNAAIVTSLNAKGLVPDTEELSLGQIGRSGSGAANESTREADVVLAVGCRFTDWDTVNWRANVVFNFPPSKLIQIDIDPSEIGRSYPTDIGIVGDAKATLEDILSALESVSNSQKAVEWAKTIRKRKSEWEQVLLKELQNDSIPIHPARVLHEVRRAAPANTLFFNDIGDIIQFSQGYLKILEPESWFINGGMMQMGWAAAAALTGKLLKPDRPSIALLGDGAFMMSSNVVATAVEYNLPATWVIFNNYGPNLERKAQLGLYGRSHAWGSFTKKGEQGTSFYNPDFVKIAEACGARGRKAKTPTEVYEAVREAVNSKDPYVIDVVINRDAATYFAPGMARGYPKSWTEPAPHM